jgi:hypothetical protein
MNMKGSSAYAEGNFKALSRATQVNGTLSLKALHFIYASTETGSCLLLVLVKFLETSNST